MKMAKQIIRNMCMAMSTFLVACSGLTNLTPDKVPENPSRTYTLSMSAYINDGSIIKDSIEPYVIIDEQFMPMKQIPNASDERIYEYDYVLPAGRKDAKYYFLLKYKVDNSSVNGGIKNREMSSPIVYKLEPLKRYVVILQSTRAPVGTVVPVLGRGFNKEDKIYIADVLADTEYVSRNTINFVVPPLDSGKNYAVSLVGDDEEIYVGDFRVDEAIMQVSPQELSIDVGQTLNMIFDLGFKAPKGGFMIDVKTNIPSSIMIEEILIKEGSSSITVPVKGISAAKGNLYINAKGFKEKIIPVSIEEAPQESIEDLKKIK